MVGNLPRDIKKEELREIVTPYGRVVNCEVISQRGYGFVTFLDHKDAAFAIYRLKEKLYQTKHLRADWSEPPSKEALEQRKHGRKSREQDKVKKKKKKKTKKKKEKKKKKKNKKKKRKKKKILVPF